MKISRRQFAAGAAATGGLIACPAVAQQAPIVIKFSHVVTNDTPKGKGALKFKELAEKYTDGKVKVEVYPNSSLYKDKEEIEALQLGAVQMLAPATAKFAPLGAKEFEALDLPFAFKDDENFQKAMKGPLAQFLFSKLEPKGVKGLAFWDNGFHMFSANKPLIKPADLQGVKVRISGSKVADRYFRLCGAIPQILAFSEVYQALQTGVVDGCENTPSNYLTQKFYEVQKNITIARHAHLQYAVIVNSKYWEGLPPDVRTALEKAMSEATDFTNKDAQQDNAEALETMKKSGKCEFHVATDAERAAWKTAMDPTYEWAIGRVGKEAVDMIRKASAA
ncbi:MAG: DctP family TRAP transporter solute-binding subunit [Hyphomicrobiales bacterium]|nr:DctP family TRAP transporter solute-binding subunit [Hyphomicrobiales bacterium]